MTHTARVSKKSVLANLAALVTGLFLILNVNINSQDNPSSIESVMNNLLEENDSKVLQPYADALSADMNSGLIYSAKISKKFSMYFGLKAAGTYINDDNPVVADANKTLDILPLAIPQLQAGYFGTQVTFRWLPPVTMASYGSVSMWGMGIKNSFTAYIKKSPVDAAVGFNINNFTYQDSKDNEMAAASSVSFNFQLSRRFSVFTFYTGIQFESTDIDLKLNKNGSIKNYKYENENKFRSVIGLNIGLGVFNINGDYSFGKTSSVSAGIGFLI